MNRYPLWKNLLIGLVLVWGLIYTLPNLYGEVPAVQVSSAKATLKLDPGTVSERMAGALKEAGIEHEGIFADLNTVRARFLSTDEQLRAKDAIERAFNPDAADPSYVVALNLLSASPACALASCASTRKAAAAQAVISTRVHPSSFMRRRRLI